MKTIFCCSEFVFNSNILIALFNILNNEAEQPANLLQPKVLAKAEPKPEPPKPVIAPASEPNQMHVAVNYRDKECM